MRGFRSSTARGGCSRCATAARIHRHAGATLSVLPWTLHGTLVSERGVRWPLDRVKILLGGHG
jgi:hypothetical protein